MRNAVLAVLAVVAGLALVVAPGLAEAATVAPALAIDRDFPDPDVLQVGDTFYAYSTNSGPNVPVATAPSLDGPWTVRPTDALPALGSWARPGRTWAPDVSRRADGTFLLYYTAWHAPSGRQCIGTATATAPAGPFKPVGTQPLVCPLRLGGAIDPGSFVDADGTRYLVYKTDGNAVGLVPGIYLQRTSVDGLSLVGAPVRILQADRPDEDGIVEAPALVRVDGRYLLLYATGVYSSSSYAESYAVATSITGPYTKAYRPLLTTASLDGAVVGPGSADVAGERIVMHGQLPGPFARGMYVAALGWANGLPVVRGSRVRYEAERGTLYHCVVRTGAAGASQGAVAAYIDYDDSWVELLVFAAAEGSHTVYVAYANGSAATAEHALTVNGAPAPAVRYPVTGWDNWHQVAVDVQLQAGWNTLRLRHQTLYAELDYLEVA